MVLRHDDGVLHQHYHRALEEEEVHESKDRDAVAAVADNDAEEEEDNDSSHPEVRSDNHAVAADDDNDRHDRDNTAASENVSDGGVAAANANENANVHDEAENVTMNAMTYDVHGRSPLEEGLRALRRRPRTTWSNKVHSPPLAVELEISQSENSDLSPTDETRAVILAPKTNEVSFSDNIVSLTFASPP